MAHPRKRTLTPRQASDIFTHFDFSCAYCGSKPPTVILLLDYSTPTKFVPACLGCILGKYKVPCNDEFFCGPVVSRIKGWRG